MAEHDATPTNTVINLVTPPQAAEPAWCAFCQSHPALAAQASHRIPLYYLPKSAISHLSCMRDTSPAVLDPAAVEAEDAFTDLCHTFQAIGFWPDCPTPYALLSPALPLPDPQTCQALGWTAAQWLQAKTALQISADATLRLKGYAGWLLTEPAFLVQLEALAVDWHQLPDEQRPHFPLGRAVPAKTVPAGAEPAPQEVVRFASRLSEFLDRWGLLQLTSWELPDPQGPLLPNRLPPDSPALPRHGVHLVLPVHYPLQGDDALLQQILTYQRQLAREQGLDESVAGLPHYKAYGHMLEVIHWERVIRSRIPAESRFRGLSTRLEEVLAGILGSSVALIQKLRKAIRSCRGGQRTKVAWLRPRNR